MADKKLYIQCRNCGHQEEVNKEFFAKVIGGAVIGLGFKAWVGFLFAGTGLALPICVAIITGGALLIANAKKVIHWINSRVPCPECGNKDWETVSGEVLELREIVKKQRQQYDDMIQQMEKDINNEVLQVDALKSTFENALNSAKRELDIYVPWLGSVFKSAEFKNKIFLLLNRGVIVKIRSGYGNLDDEAYNVKFQTAIERFLDNKNLKRNYQLGRLRFYRDDSHAKLFIVDDEY